MILMEQNIVLQPTDSWASRLEFAADAYARATANGTTLNNSQRESAVYEFQEWTHSFKLGGKAAEAALELGLYSDDALKRDTAARILAAVSNPDTIRRATSSIIEFGLTKLNNTNLK